MGDNQEETKKPRRSQRLSQATPEKANKTPVDQNYLPSPLTHHDSSVTNTTVNNRDGTASPPQTLSQRNQATPQSSPQLTGLSSPPGDTQVLSQFIYPPRDLGDELEEEEGTWGFLAPIDPNVGHRMVMKRRAFCPAPTKPLEISRSLNDNRKHHKSDALVKDEEKYENDKQADDSAFPAGGYLIGRHPECDMRMLMDTISNRHCLIFNENKEGESIAVIEDLSSNGTYVNDQLLGRNKRRELQDGDEIGIVDKARFIFRYPRSRMSSAFGKQFRILQQLGKGHFATVYLCVDRATGFKFAVKKFERRMGDSQKSQTEGLQQEIAVLMSVSHPNVLCLKETFEESDGVYLILELAAEGELFNWIVSKQKLTEAETRKVFIQLFQGVKYLHERNIVHRDIKPENILLTDKSLSVKLADFGLAKIIGEESFTTTLCGTPSYVAPEILENTRHRKYTRAVDVWSLGVVLYICLCGFPPFSDELYSREAPYTLAQQIKMGHFNYPSPYWDSIGDPALDLIDRMLTVNVEDRITIDECLEHPWTRNVSSDDANYIHPGDSTDGLTGAIHQLKMDFSKRKIKRQRTLLADINDIKVSKVIKVAKTTHPGAPEQEGVPESVTVWEKNPAGKKGKVSGTQAAEIQRNEKQVKSENINGKNNGGSSSKTPEQVQQEMFMDFRSSPPRPQQQEQGKLEEGKIEVFADDRSSRYLPQEVPDTEANHHGNEATK